MDQNTKQQLEIPGCSVIYICGTGGMGKTWVSKALEKQAADHDTKILIVESDGNDIKADDILKACYTAPDDTVDIVVCWGPGQEENFPVKPFRVIRISKD